MGDVTNIIYVITPIIYIGTNYNAVIGSIDSWTTV